MTGATCGPRPGYPSGAHDFPFSFGIHDARSLVFCAVFFVLLSFCFRQVCCLSFDLRLLIIPLVFSIFQEGHKERQSARMSIYCLTPNERLFIYIMAVRTSYILMR
jgi:hypothetical protein